MKCGIVGLPNVGKSLLFNLLTRSQLARSENFPFCTIEPNVAKVTLVDERLQKLSKISKSEKIIYSSLEFFDIAGLVPGASEGAGLGNKFLSHIAQVDSIVMLLRCFKNEDILYHFEDINPIRDLETIELEIKCYDVNLLQKHLLKCKDTIQKKYLEGLIYKLENNEKVEDPMLLSAKPIFVFCNGVDDYGVGNYCTKRLLKYFTMSLCEVKEDILDQFIRINFEMLDLITYFTTGPKETRAWTIKKGTNAQEAAGKIHTDFISGFVKAEVTPYFKYIKEGAHPQIQGKSYIVQDGDIIEFKINSKSKK